MMHADMFAALPRAPRAPHMPWGSPVERERRRRIRLALWAYAYEVLAEPMVSDAEYDAEALASDPNMKTGRHDAWWRRNFSPATGQWIHSHPEFERVAALHARIKELG